MKRTVALHFCNVAVFWRVSVLGLWSRNDDKYVKMTDNIFQVTDKIPKVTDNYWEVTDNYVKMIDKCRNE